MRIRLFLLFTIFVVSSFWGVCQADSNSIEKLRQKAESGDPNSQFALAKKYFDGRRGIPQDYNEAAKWFTKAAQQGLADAQNNLGTIYSDGQGVLQDYNEAVKWYTKASQQGHSKAQYNLGLMYSTGQGVPQDYNEAAKWFTKAAALGLAEAQINLGAMYYFGNGVLQNYDEAVKCLSKAASRGHAETQYALGLIYSTGQGVQQDYKEAAKWFTKAATGGHAEAQHRLAVMYGDGKGVPQNYQMSIKWFTKAAAQGNTMAQFNLGAIYYFGSNGVPRDYVESYKWFLLAEMNGDKKYAPWFRKTFLQNEITPSQIEEAQQKVSRARKIRELPAEKKEISKEDKLIAGIIESLVAKREKASKENRQTTEKAESTSTGFLITSDGYILTACHSVEETAKVEVLIYDDNNYSQKSYPAKVVLKDEAIDIAILKIEDVNLPFLPIVSSSTAKTGDAAFTMGYPQIGLQGTEPKFTEGSISSLSGLTNNQKYFQISIPVQPGNSGGPLVNDKGEVIGIIIAKLNDVASFLITGSLPQNVNYALKSSFVLPFIESVPGLLEKIATSGSAKDRSAAIETAKKSVVLVATHK
jgi:TPR repeat protein